MVSKVIAFSIAIAFSYLGHHQFSFGVSGRHHVYGLRFILVSAILVAATFLLTSALHLINGLDHRLIVAIVAASYAATSYAF